jgi:hypothetical protein
MGQKLAEWKWPDRGQRHGAALLVNATLMPAPQGNKQAGYPAAPRVCFNK